MPLAARKAAIRSVVRELLFAVTVSGDTRSAHLGRSLHLNLDTGQNSFQPVQSSRRCGRPSVSNVSHHQLFVPLLQSIQKCPGIQQSLATSAEINRPRTSHVFCTSSQNEPPFSCARRSSECTRRVRLVRPWRESAALRADCTTAGDGSIDSSDSAVTVDVATMGKLLTETKYHAHDVVN